MNKKRWWSAVFLAYVAFIFSNSMQPAAVSSQQSGQVLDVVRQFLMDAGWSGFGVTEHLIRKSAHFGEYALLGMLLVQNVRLRVVAVPEAVLWTALTGFLIPFADETIQLFVTGRSGQISDVWLDMAGVVFGILLFLAAGRLMGRKRRERTVGEKL